MVAFKEEFPYLRAESGQLFEFDRDWLHAAINRAADQAGYPSWWLTEHVTESIAFYLHLRNDENVVAFVRQFFDQGKPVAAICHAPWVLIDAGVVRGRTMTSWPTVGTDLHNAGATWVDEPCVVDGPIVTARFPHDLGPFCRAISSLVAERRAIA